MKRGSAHTPRSRRDVGGWEKQDVAVTFSVGHKAKWCVCVWCGEGMGAGVMPRGV